MDHTASSGARRIRSTQEGQGEALGGFLEAYRNYLRLIASTCFLPELRGKPDPSDVLRDARVQVHDDLHPFRGTTERGLLALRLVRTRALRRLGGRRDEEAS